MTFNKISYISLPLFVDLPRKRSEPKRIYLNLNIYRNLHFQLNNQAKIVFNEIISGQIDKLPQLEKIKLIYTLYPKTKRKYDIANICCVVDKFFCDALVNFQKIQDDDHEHILEIRYNFGEIDKINSRVMVSIFSE